MECCFLVPVEQQFVFVTNNDGICKTNYWEAINYYLFSSNICSQVLWWGHCGVQFGVNLKCSILHRPLWSNVLIPVSDVLAFFRTMQARNTCTDLRVTCIYLRSNHSSGTSY